MPSCIQPSATAGSCPRRDAMRFLTAIVVIIAVSGCGTAPRTPAQRPEPAGDSFPEYSIANAEAAGFRPQPATVRSVDGEAQYSGGGVWKQLRPNQRLTNGAQIRTGRGAKVYLLVNGHASVLELVGDTEVDLTEMMLGRDGAATQTALELRKGTIHGVASKLPSDSSLQVRASEVVLKIHGTDLNHGSEFQVRADGWVSLGSGVATVTSGGKEWQLQTGMYFDPKKNEIGLMPPSGGPLEELLEREHFLHPEPPDIQPPRPIRPWPGSSPPPPS